MAEKKKIPCRVCGKLFVPCSYCQSHADVFRWRNFACSRGCAAKYINDTISYRESLKRKEESKYNFEEKNFTEENIIPKRKNNKKSSNSIEKI